MKYIIIALLVAVSLIAISKLEPTSRGVSKDVYMSVKEADTQDCSWKIIE